MTPTAPGRQPHRDGVLPPWLRKRLACPACGFLLGAIRPCPACGRPWTGGDFLAAPEPVASLARTYDAIAAQERARTLDPATRARFDPVDRRMLSWARGYVLDAGCGTGRLLRRLAAAPEVAGVVGIDISRASLAWAARSGVPVLRADLTALPFAPASFDTVVAAYGVLAHVPPLAAARSFARAVRAGGFVAVHQFGAWALRAASWRAAWRRGRPTPPPSFHPHALRSWRAWWRPWAAAGWFLEQFEAWARIPRWGAVGPAHRPLAAPLAWDVVVVARRRA